MSNISTFTDSRDGNTYKTVKIGNQIWMAENLKYRGVDYYFPNRDSDNFSTYGCLYTWENAIKACPEGWHLPTKEEFEQLLTTTSSEINSSSIRDSTWSNGSNSSGFSVLPAGLRDFIDEFYEFGSQAYFWSATSYDDEYAYRLSVGSGLADIIDSINTHAFSVRCIKDVD